MATHSHQPRRRLQLCKRVGRPGRLVPVTEAELFGARPPREIFLGTLRLVRGRQGPLHYRGRLGAVRRGLVTLGLWYMEPTEGTEHGYWSANIGCGTSRLTGVIFVQKPTLAKVLSVLRSRLRTIRSAILREAQLADKVVQSLNHLIRIVGEGGEPERQPRRRGK